MQIYNPLDWYWLADDGRIFSSRVQALVPASDPDYIAFGSPGTTWPRDAAGEQTDAALQEVLEPYGLSANLKYYTANVRWKKEQGGITLASGMPIKTNDRAQAKITGAYSAAVAQPAVVTPWAAADGTVYPLDGVAIVAMNNELLVHINNCFSISADMIAGIDDGTITTREQIDAAFGAQMTQARKDWLKH